MEESRWRGCQQHGGKPVSGVKRQGGMGGRAALGGALPATSCCHTRLAAGGQAGRQVQSPGGEAALPPPPSSTPGPPSGMKPPCPDIMTDTPGRGTLLRTTYSRAGRSCRSTQWMQETGQQSMAVCGGALAGRWGGVGWGQGGPACPPSGCRAPGSSSPRQCAWEARGRERPRLLAGRCRMPQPNLAGVFPPRSPRSLSTL